MELDSNACPISSTRRTLEISNVEVSISEFNTLYYKL